MADRDEPEGSRTLSTAAAAIAHATAGFSELHSYLDRLCFDLGLEYRLEPASGPPFIAGRHARIIATGGVPVGEIGEIHPETLTARGIRTPVVAFEIDLACVMAQRRRG